MNLILKHRLMGEEGFRDRPYKDTKGFLTIGYGWCLDKRPLNTELAEIILEYHINQSEKELLTLCADWYLKLSQTRQSVILDMVYNMGMNGFLKFKNTIQAIKEGDFNKASDEMLDSAWHVDVGKRAEALVDLFRKG